MKLFPQQFHKGFTLMEVMVSVSIFAIIVTVGIVALLTINNAYRKSQTERQAIDSLTYMLESMSRRIRTAETWTSPNYGGTSTLFSIVDQDGITVNYHWDQINDRFLMDIDNPSSINNPAVPTASDYDLTPKNVHISTTYPDGTAVVGGGVRFIPLKTGSSGQPYLQINIGGYVTNGKAITPFLFQTSVSKRVVD
jgi:prepilin-type N-terminal cleavage/methylation domain-containing protein